MMSYGSGLESKLSPEVCVLLWRQILKSHLAAKCLVHKAGHSNACANCRKLALTCHSKEPTVFMHVYPTTPTEADWLNYIILYLLIQFHSCKSNIVLLLLAEKGVSGSPAGEDSSDALDNQVLPSTRLRTTPALDTHCFTAIFAADAASSRSVPCPKQINKAWRYNTKRQSPTKPRSDCLDPELPWPWHHCEKRGTMNIWQTRTFIVLAFSKSTLPSLMPSPTSAPLPHVHIQQQQLFPLSIRMFWWHHARGPFHTNHARGMASWLFFISLLFFLSLQANQQPFPNPRPHTQVTQVLIDQVTLLKPHWWNLTAHVPWNSASAWAT